MSRQTYVLRDGKLVPKEEAFQASASFSPYVVADIAPFVTQDGVSISSRSQLRAYEQTKGVRQCGNDWTGSSKPSWWDTAVSKAQR